MKNRVKLGNPLRIKLFLCAIAILVPVLLLNFKVTTLQGINYRVSAIKIPLYLKLIDFFDRHYNYKRLVEKIIKGNKNKEENVLKIFEWTYGNIKKMPVGLPVMDDHAWYTIIRGYGVNDQFSDVFTTLCNYAGVEAFFFYLYSEDHLQKVPLSFVRLSKKLFLFDPYHGVFFKDTNGALADIETLKSGNCILVSIGNETNIDYKTYTPLFSSLERVQKIESSRANIQSPLKRLIYEIKTRFSR